MKVAFFHDHRFRRHSTGTYFSTGGLSYRVFQRYLKHFESITVVGRVQNTTAEQSTGLTVASGDRVHMECVERGSPLSLTLGAREREHVRDVLARADCAIVRLPSLLGLVACREASATAKPILVEVAGCAFDAAWHHGSRAGRLMAPGLYALTRRAIGKAPYAIYVSSRYLQARYPCRGISVACSNAIIEVPNPEVLKRRLAKIAEPREIDPSIGLVGSLDVDYKGHDTALRALRRMRQRYPHVRLQFLGPGNSSRWRRLARSLGVESRVDFMGTLPAGPQVLAWMDGLDMLWIPSLTEGLPRALIEAMSRGLPAVGSRAGGIPELLGDGVGLTHAPNDHRALAALTCSLLQDRATIQKCARRNFEVARDYAAPVLEARRDECLREFARYVTATRPAVDVQRR